MTLDRSLTVLGAVSIVIGLSTIAYTHLSLKPDLERSVDVARRLIDDAIFGSAALAQFAEATDAVRGPAAAVTTRSVAIIGEGRVGVVRIAARTLDTATRRHTLPSFQPVLQHLGDRLRETQAILADSDPARGALLADLIAGIYLVAGAALMLLARAFKVSAPGAAI